MMVSLICMNRKPKHNVVYYIFIKLNYCNMENNTFYGLHGKLAAKEGKGSELAQILLIPYTHPA